MSHFRSIFRHISTKNSYQVSDYGPVNNKFSTFSPSDIVGLTTWIDVADSAVVTSSGGFITSIANKGSGGGTFESPSASQRAYLSATSINGRDSAGFDGVDDVLTSSIAAYSCFGWPPPPGSSNVQAFTMCFALKPNRIDTSNIYPYALDVIAAQGNASINANLGSSQGRNERLWLDNGSTSEADYVKSSPGQLSAGTTFCAAITMLTQTYDLYVNGTFTSTVARYFSPTAVAGSLRIGNEIYPSNGGPAKIDLCEFLIYSGSLSPSEISTLTFHLKDKWGIT